MFSPIGFEVSKSPQSSFIKVPKPMLFGAKITTGQKNGDNPWDYFITEINKTPVEYKLSAPEKANLHGKIVELIRLLQKDSGTLSPMHSNESTSILIEEQSIAIPQTLDPNLRALDGKARQSEANAWQTAGLAMTNRFKTPIAKLKELASQENPITLPRLIQNFNAFLGKGVTIDLNTEFGELDRLAEGKQSTIFIANHPNPPHDLPATFTFISALYKKYAQLGNLQPPKMDYVLTERIPNSFPEDFKTVFEKAGAVGVDATTYPTAERAAANQKIRSTIDGFKSDRNNLFIFPEGGRARYKSELSLQERYQYGIGKMVLNILQAGKPEVKVVALGMTPNNVLNADSALYFKKENNQILVAQENLITGKKSEYKPIRPGNEPIILTKGNKKADKLMARLIAGVTCNSLEDSVKQAELRDPKITSPKVSSTYAHSQSTPTEILKDVSERLLQANISSPIKVANGFVPSSHRHMEPQGEFSINSSDKGPVQFRLLENKKGARELQKLESSNDGQPLKVNVLTLSSNDKVHWRTFERAQTDKPFSAPGNSLVSKDKAVVKNFKTLFQTMKSK